MKFNKGGSILNNLTPMMLGSRSGYGSISPYPAYKGGNKNKSLRLNKSNSKKLKNKLKTIKKQKTLKYTKKNKSLKCNCKKKSKLMKFKGGSLSFSDFYSPTNNNLKYSLSRSSYGINENDVNTETSALANPIPITKNN